MHLLLYNNLHFKVYLYFSATTVTYAISQYKEPSVRNSLKYFFLLAIFCRKIRLVVSDYYVIRSIEKLLGTVSGYVLFNVTSFKLELIV